MTLLCLLVAFQLGAVPAAHVAEIRVHGNYATPEAEVLRIAGLAVDGPYSTDAVEAAQARLDASGRFESVTILTRYRSIADSSQILLVILVDERPGTAADGTPPGKLQRWLGRGMWAPVLGFEDGYGFTYGARVSLVDAMGPRSRVSVPLTWGGERRAALEAERRFGAGWATRVFGSVAAQRRVNPYDDTPDNRRGVAAGVEQQATSWLRTTVAARRVHVGFGRLEESHTAVNADVAIDTRVDPAFPRNAVVAHAGWQRLFAAGRLGIDRLSAGGTAFIGVVGQAVMVVGAGLDAAREPLPAYERPLLGGAQSLRGHRAGAFTGDNRAVASAELRVPLTSLLSAARFGVKVFTDMGTVWDDGEPFRRQRWHRGAGAGVFATFPAFTAGVDVARSEDDWRVHVTVRLGDGARDPDIGRRR